MLIPQNPLFKLVALRGGRSGLSIDPVADHPDDIVVASVDALPSPVLDQPRPALEAALRQAGALSGSDVAASALSRFGRETLDRRSWNLEDFAQHASTVSNDRAEEEYRQILRSWLRVRLLGDAADALEVHESALRVGRLLRQLRQDPQLLAPAGEIDVLLRARVVLPVRWRRAGSSDPRPTGGDAGPTRKDLEDQWMRTVNRIRLREGIQAKVARVHVRWSEDAPPPTLPRELSTNALRAMARPPLDARFYSMVEAALSPDERGEMDTALSSGGVAFRPDLLDGLLDSLGVETLGDSANSLCERIRLWEDDEETRLPPGRPLTEEAVSPRVVATGWGDLVVARERLVGYEATDIAHVENVLAGEKKVREHERQLMTEEFLEEEDEESIESETETETSDRNELQTNSQSSVEQE
ncbi:MAG: hypothetical protein QNK05_05060, partial [Myxococcota bacterium]|nr:hypothetical protein [Myxococcota bacterium]